jgi:hypothetical protein
MFCAYCQRELPEDAAFCNNCGRPVQSHTTVQLSQASSLPPPDALQRFLIRVFQPALAGNALFGIVLGSVVAACAGVVMSWLLLTIVHFITLPVVSSTSSYANNEEFVISRILGIVPSHMSFRDSLQLFMVIQGVGIHLSSGGSGAFITVPLNGLLIVPALFLTFGGYIAASTDLHNRIQSSLVRGAAMAIPYALLLLMMSWQVDGAISTGGPETLTMDTAGLLFFGLLWGALFGLLGASLKLARGQWRHLLHRYLSTSTRPQVAGMIIGAGYACILGLGLSLLTLYGLLAYTSISVPLLVRNVCITDNWQEITAWGIAQGPLHAVNLFFFSFGATIAAHTPSQQGCFYSDLSQTAFTLRNQDLHLTPWTYALVLIPAFSLFTGGRLSAAISRARGSGPGAISGALIAVPFAVVMLLLSFASSITFTFVSPGSVTPTVQSMGTSATDLILWALLSGAFFGALGGIYQGSTAKALGKLLLAIPVSLVEAFAKPLYLLLGIMSRQPSSSLRNPARSLLYSAFSCTLLLAIAAAVTGSLLIADNQTITLQVNQHFRDIISTLLITLPGLLLFCAWATALCRDPVEKGQTAQLEKGKHVEM